MTTPTADRVHLREQSAAHMLEQLFKQSHGQAPSGHEIGGGREREAGQARQGRARRIAVQDLQQEDMHGGHRTKHALWIQ